MSQSESLVDGAVYASARFVETCRPFTRMLGKIEDLILADDIKETPLTKPIYVTGLARSGSTILLEFIASHPDTASHRYSDFPFIDFPYLWNKSLSFMPRKQEVSHERPHADGINITSQSPEAMEEMLWMDYFPNLHNPELVNTLGKHISNPSFEKKYKNHIRKLLAVRKATRYVSKGNYNLTRLAYIHKILPDAKFIIPLRDPVTHVTSLMRQHENFLEASKKDPRVAAFMRIAGHFEFGGDLRLVRFGQEEIPPPAEMTAVDWADYWCRYYQFALDALEKDPELAANVRFVEFEQLCASPQAQLEEILAFLGLADENSHAIAFSSRISKPKNNPSPHDATIRERTGKTYESIRAFICRP